MDISTRHIPEDDSRLISESRLVCVEDKHGWFIWVPEREEIREICEESGLSANLVAILEIAHVHGCPLVWVSGNGPEYEDLDFFNW